MHAVKPRGSPPPPPPRVAPQLHVLAFAATEPDLRARPAAPAGDGTRPHPPAARPATDWAQFTAIGLGPPPHVERGRGARLAVAVYRLLGFVVLTVIVVVLLGYLATTVFYMVNRSWLVPTVISPTDEHVLALETELMTQQSQLDRVSAELDAAERAVAAEQRFQQEFAAAIKADLAARKAALARVRSLASDASSTRKSIHSTNRAFAAQQSARLAREYQAGLVDRGRMMDGKLQVAQISGSSLALAEKQAELDTRVDELSTAVAGLTAIVAEEPGNAPLSYDVLTIKRSYDASKLALAKASDTRTMLAASVRRQRALLANLEGSGYLRAVREQATVAVVPYDNVKTAHKGAALYACRAAMLLCHEVGRVIEVLPGEVSVRHPHRDKQLRGRMIIIELGEAEAARNEVLFAGAAPLWL